MALLRTLVRGLSSQPGYTLMRGMARFASARELTTQVRRLAHASRTPAWLANCEAQAANSPFAALDREAFVRDLSQKGLATGLVLPPEMVSRLVAFAAQTPCHADRRPELGFMPDRHREAEAALGKPVLLAQYFNTEAQCPTVAALANDPVLRWIAGAYLGSVPQLVGVNMWWTFPVQASQEDRDRHAHLFHRDVDDFRFFKFFFYLTDVPAGEGAHVCVVASHQHPPMLRTGDRWNIRRYSDEEIAGFYPPDQVLEICGPAGTGFAENTLCVHKGRTPATKPRLLLQIQFALFDYGAMHDRMPAERLQSLI